MGGAIALRLAALSPQLVDAVVSSVPSGTRFRARSTALEVAVKFLKNSHEQFNIGQRVVAQQQVIRTYKRHGLMIQMHA